MSDRFEVRPGRFAGPILASGLVLLLGGIGVLATVVVGGGNPYFGLGVFVGVLVGMLLLGLLLRSKPVDTLASRFGWMTVRDPNDPGDYIAKAMRIKRRHTGTNQPPTVEDLREARESLNTWVPSGPHSARPKQK